MAAAQVVITRSNGDAPTVGGLFAGLSFFLVQRLPSRSAFIQKIQSNGGRVVKLEDQADYKIADHFRKDCPFGSISYTFIDTAIRDGELPDPDDHLAGRPQGSVREPGSAIPGKSTRTPYTAEDDRQLWQWVERCKAQGNVHIRGNEMYQQLEATNPRHTYQSWRDRYIKRLMDKPPAGVEVKVSVNAPPSPPTAQDQQEDIPLEANTRIPETDGTKEEPEVESLEPEFTEEELELLMEQGNDIEKIHEERMEDAWFAWAVAYPEHSAEEWRDYWRQEARPEFLRRRKEAKEVERQAQRKIEEKKVSEGREEAQKRKRQIQEMLEVDESDEYRGALHDRMKRRRSPAKPLTQLDEVALDNGKDSEPQQDVPTSELDRAVQVQLQQEALVVESADQAAQDQKTDAQAEAQAQFDEEVLGIPRINVGLNTHSTANLPDSDINREADDQIRRESFERHEEMEVEGDGSQPETPDVPEPNGDALTEANLASQQAQHKAQLFRGTDIPEDDDERDGDRQDEYVKFLQSVTRQSTGGQEVVIKTVQQEVKNLEASLEPEETDDRLQSLQNDLDTDAMLDLPMSSQQEIDEALEDIVQWPESPKAYQQRAVLDFPSQSLQIETQVPYPKLPTQHSEISKPHHENLFWNQASLPGEVSYPSLKREKEPLTASQLSDLDADVVIMQNAIRGQQRPDNEESHVLVEVGSLSSSGSSDVEVVQEEVDLAVPAPEAGWELSSSPAKALGSSPSRQTRRQQYKAAKLVPEVAADSDVNVEIVEEIQEVVEVSTSSSSSSSDDESKVSDPMIGDKGGGKKALETQDILNAETQQPDFAMPLPPDSDVDSDDFYTSSPPAANVNTANLESQRVLTQTQTLPDADLNTYIDTQILHGYAEASIIAALKCTSMRPDLAELVLLDEKAGRGLPKDLAGIWTEEEDGVLESGNARGLRKLEEKHSWRECEERMKFLEDYREEDEEE